MAWAPASAADVALVVLALSVPSALLVLAIVIRGYDVHLRLRPRARQSRRRRHQLEAGDDVDDQAHDQA